MTPAPTALSLPSGAERFNLAVAVSFTAVFYGFATWYARFIDWNAIRLAPAAALLSGAPIYPAPETGVLTGHIYSPLGALAFAPAAWLGDVSTMVSAGAGLALMYFALPFVVLARVAVRRGQLAVSDGVAITTAVLLLAAFDPRLRCAATMIHAESPAVGLGALAIVMAAATRAWGWAGALAVAAVLAKQTLLPTWLALGVIACVEDRRAAVRFILGSGLCALPAALCITLAGNWHNLVFNCLWIPAHHPWLTSGYTFTFGGPPTAQDLASRARALVDAFLQTASHWWPAMALSLWSLRPEILRSFRSATPMVRTAAFGSACGLAQFPLALASLVKVGGDVNVLDPSLTPLTLSLAAMAMQALSSVEAPSRATMRKLMTALLLTLMVCNVPRLTFLVQTTFTRPDPNRSMEAYLRSHPDQLYLPWNPLLTWTVEHRRDHFEYGVFDRALAGRPVSPAHYRAHLPRNLKVVAVRKSQPPLRLDMYRFYLGDLKATASPPGLEDWNFFEIHSRLLP